MVAQSETFEALAPNIWLEFIVDGRLAYWDGLGLQKDPKLRYKMVQFGAGGLLTPNLVNIDLGLRFESFVGLLDGLTADGQIEEGSSAADLL